MELGKEDFFSFMGKDEYNHLQIWKKFNFSSSKIIHNNFKIVSAVDELHQLKYFHRDLKPENFIIIENSNQNLPHLKLIDFGLCKHMHNINRLT